MEFVGRTVKKEVQGVGIITGLVKSYDSASGFAEIVYEDGNSEELESSEVAALMMQGETELVKVKRPVGRKPKKRRRVERKHETSASSGNTGENLVISMPNDSEFSGVLDEHVSASGILNVNGELHSGLVKSSGVGNGPGGNLIFGTEIMGNVNSSVSSNGGIEIQWKESGYEQKSKENVSANGNSIITDCVKDGLDLNAGINLNEDLDLNDGCSSLVNPENEKKKRGCIDLNLDVNNDIDISLNVTDLSCSAVEKSKRECNFDLNVEVCDEVKETEGYADVDILSEGGCLFGKMGRSSESETDINQNSVEDDSIRRNLDDIKSSIKLEVINSSLEHAGKDASLSLIEEKEDGVDHEGIGAIDSLGFSNVLSVKNCDSVETRQEHSPSEPVISISHEGQDELEIECKQGSIRRKRRKLSENLKFTPRRSSRRASALKHDSSTDDLSMSHVPSALTEEKTVISGHKQYEPCFILPPKLQLPPSSQNLNLDDIPVLDLFSIYACLRSFSTILFLSPFELEDFVAALKSKNPNILFDSIHVSILLTLRKHLEYLSSEGCESASNCLRSLNWDWLDLVTWPIFMAEYLLIHGSGLKNGFDLKHLMFRSDYHKHPVTVKVEILQCLCDDMIEVEAIRLELNRRSLVTETDMSFDQSMYFDICKKRRAQMDVSGGSCLDEIVDDTTDWNSDECCLCKMDGSLICCDGCPAAFHSRCVGIASDHLPEGDWYCPECAIARHKPWMKAQKSPRGADLLGIDHHGHLYFHSYGYLLVSDSSNMGSLFTYYHRNDLHVVIEVLKSADDFYGGILMAIYKHWDIPFNSNGGASKLEVLNQNAGENMHIKAEYSAIYPSLAPLTSSETFLDKNQADDQRKVEDNSSQEFLKAGNQLDSMTTIVSPCVVASEGSGDTTQMRSASNNILRHGPHDSNGSDGSLNQSGIPEKSHPVGHCSLTSSSLDERHKINITSAGTSYSASTLSTGNRDTSEVPCGIDYINYYSFARTASLVAEELMCKSSEKINKNSVMSEEDLISGQAKAIIKKSTNFYWPSSRNVNAAAQKEKCGWCLFCKAENDDRDCLFNTLVRPVREVSKSNLVGLLPKENQNAHLRDVICHILSLEDRLRGLLSGPWLNLRHSTNWRKDLLDASDVASVKCLLLTLESNLRLLALSADWSKHVDSIVTVGSACHIVASSSRTSSRHNIGRKRTRCSDTESNSSSNTSGYWWRGGRLSRHLFNWKVLPCSLVTKAARQAGCTKIPGILYPENSDFARRSKCVAWRAAVETSISVEQLAIQVRELDSNIRWHDIENTHPLYALDKESRKSIRLFKKATVRRKCNEKESAKYLLDFGKRRAVPDVVMKHGSLLEQSSSDRKKYWLEESYVPLHLIKNFEDKKIARKSNEMKPVKVLENSGLNNKVTKKRGFSYLFSRMERSDYHQCGQCNKDVPIRDAVSCLYCKGFFHKRHARKSGGTTECTYSCHKCQDEMHVKANSKRRKVDPKPGKIQSQKCKKLPSGGRSVNLKGSKNSPSKGRPVKSRTNKKVQPSIPLRRSARKAKCLSLQNKKNAGRKKGRKSKPKKVTSRKPRETTSHSKKLAVTFEPKKRSHVWNSYWLNGLRLSRKPNDERVILFKEKNHLAPSEGFAGTFDQPKCRLCCGDGCTLNYIACEICGEWFHGDAFGLTLENVSKLIGFRCHVCRDRAAPVCPHVDNNALTHAESNAATDCAEELSNPVSLQPLSEV